METVTHQLGHKQIVGLFEEWDTRYRANPEQFWTDVQHLIQNTPQTYGEAAATYFEFLIDEFTADQVK